MATSATKNRTALANAVEKLQSVKTDLKSVDLRAARGDADQRDAIQEARAATDDALYSATQALQNA